MLQWLESREGASIRITFLDVILEIFLEILSQK